MLKRVFEIDSAHRANCRKQIKIIAAILESPVIERILTHLGLQARAPPQTLERERKWRKPRQDNIKVHCRPRFAAAGLRFFSTADSAGRVIGKTWRTCTANCSQKAVA